MTRKTAGRWQDGELQEIAVSCGPGGARVGHGRKLRQFYAVHTGRISMRLSGGGMQKGSKFPPPCH